MNKWLRIVLASCIAASLYLFVKHTDFQQVADSMQQIGYRFVLLVLTTFAAYLLGSLSWQYCMGNGSKNISAGRLFLIRHIGETVSLLNPASILVGDAYKIFLLRKHRIEKNTVIASLLISRTLMIVTQLALFSAAVLLLIITSDKLILPFRTSHILILIPALVALSLPLVVYRQRLTAYILTTTVGRRLKTVCKGWKLKLQEIRIEITCLLQQHRKRLVLATLFATLHWVLGSLEFFFILKFLGLKVTLLKALIIDMGVIFFKSAGAFIPGQIGIEEYGNKIMLAAIGIPGIEIWVTASILRRARQLVWIIIGLVLYWLLFRKRNIQVNGNIVCDT